MNSYVQRVIEETKAKMEAKEKEIEDQNTALNNRLTAMYKNGNAGMVDVILSSESVEDLLSNVGMVHKILESDQELLRKLQKDYEIPPLDIYLYKHIPAGAGLGGGSSDAAFMMKLINERFQLGLSDEALEEKLATLGADCPFFVRNRPVFATGIGNIFTPISLELIGWHIVLVKPDIYVSTREAYAGVEPQRPTLPLTEIVKRPVEEWQQLMKNDFERSVFARYPVIAAIKDQLLDLGATYAAMSGSGSALYGLFREPIDHVEEKFSGCFVRQRGL